MIIVEPTETGMREAVAALWRDEVVAYPTETVYGLAANPFSVAALGRLWQVKGRDGGNPVLLIVSDESQLAQVVTAVSDTARRCIELYWPGPLTLLLPKHDRLPCAVTAGHAKVAVRQSSHPVALRLCREAGIPLTSTSANLSGEAPAVELAGLGLEGVAVGIDGGRLVSSLPSTVFDPDEGVVVRQGAIAEADLRSALSQGR